MQLTRRNQHLPKLQNRSATIKTEWMVSKAKQTRVAIRQFNLLNLSATSFAIFTLVTLSLTTSALAQATYIPKSLNTSDATKQADRKEEPTEQDPSIDKSVLLAAIADLSDPKFAKREAAQLVIWKTGEEAIPLLQSALKDLETPEAIARCIKIIEMFEFGIYPDTPPKVVEEIKKFSKSDVRTKSLIINDLLKRAMYLQAVRLVESEPEGGIRIGLDKQVLPYIKNFTKTALQKGDWKSAKRFLSFAAETAPNETAKHSYARDYAVFVSLTGDLDKEIQMRQIRRKESKNRILANLFVVKGDLAKAREAIEGISASAFRNVIFADICMRQQDWKALVNDDRFMKELSRKAGQTGLPAVYSRLAKAPQKFEREIDEIRQKLIVRASTAFYCTEAFMICHEWDEAIQTAKLYSYPIAFDLLCFRSEFEQAFKLIKFDYSADKDAAAKWLLKIDKLEAGKKNSAWKTDVYPPSGVDSKYITEQIAENLAWQLHRLGQKEQAKLLLEEMAKTSDSEQPKRIVACIKAGLKCDHREWATKIANEQLKLANSLGARQTILKLFFPNHSGLATDLMELILLKPEMFSVDLNSTVPEFIRQIQLAIEPEESELFELEKIQSIFELHDQRFLKKAKRDKTIATIHKNRAQLARIHQQSELAIEMIKKATEATPTHALHLKLGNWYCEVQEWKLAIREYQQAFEHADQSDSKYSDGERALSAYLEGRALKALGQIEKGEARMKLAEILPLSKSHARYQLATGLQKAGLEEEANRNFVNTYKFSLLKMSDWWLHRAESSAGNVLRKTDALAAAGVWELSVIHTTSNSSKYNEILGYPRELLLVHEKRGTEWLKAGKPELAVEEFKLAVGISDIGSKSQIGLVKSLTELGRSDEADKSFQEAFDRFNKVLSRFPNSAFHNNNLAWLCVSLNRKLDLAETLSKKAIEANPKSSSFRDTLAAIHFANSDFDKAVEVQRVAVELSTNKAGPELKLKKYEEALEQSDANKKNTNNR